MTPAQNSRRILNSTPFNERIKPLKPRNNNMPPPQKENVNQATPKFRDASLIPASNGQRQVLPNSRQNVTTKELKPIEEVKAKQVGHVTRKPSINIPPNRAITGAQTNAPRRMSQQLPRSASVKQTPRKKSPLNTKQREATPQLR